MQLSANNKSTSIFREIDWTTVIIYLLMILAGVALVLGALSVSIIHDKNENA